MSTFWTILSMIVIGAFVGSSTNALAIKMLFRPYKAIFIGKWKLPFTPGIIPKRKEELARQLGNLVTNHLLTSDGIKDKLLNARFQKELRSTIEKQVFRVFSTDKTVTEFLNKQNIIVTEEIILEKVQLIVEQKYEETLLTWREKKIGEVLPEAYIEKWNNKMPLLADLIVSKGTEYFEGPKGRELIRSFYERFLEEKQGSFAKMLYKFLATIDVASILQPEIIKFIESDSTKVQLISVISKEYEELLTAPIGTIEGKLKKENIIAMIMHYTKEALPIEKYLETPLKDILSFDKAKWSEDIAEYSVNLSSKLIADYLEELLSKMELSKVVQEQVESFPIEILEKIIINIAGKELKMITILGGVLGGLIGLLQGLLSVTLI